MGLGCAEGMGVPHSGQDWPGVWARRLRVANAPFNFIFNNIGNGVPGGWRDAITLPSVLVQVFDGFVTGVSSEDSVDGISTEDEMIAVGLHKKDIGFRHGARRWPFLGCKDLGGCLWRAYPCKVEEGVIHGSTRSGDRMVLPEDGNVVRPQQRVVGDERERFQG